MDNKSLTIVTPCYNEEASLPNFFPELLAFIEEHDYKLIVVNDGSTDKSLPILQGFKSRNLTILNHKVNKGYGGAIKTGIKGTQTEYIVTIDADGQHILDGVTNLYKLAIEKDADMIVGSRVSEKEATVFRGIGKKLLHGTARFLTEIKIQDLNSGMKLYRTELAKKYLHLYPNTMAFSGVICMVFYSQHHLVMEETIKISDRARRRLHSGKAVPEATGSDGNRCRVAFAQWTYLDD